MKYKEIPRRKFTEKQLEMLEKCHWLRLMEGKHIDYNHYGLFEKITKLLF